MGNKMSMSPGQNVGAGEAPVQWMRMMAPTVDPAHQHVMQKKPQIKRQHHALPVAQVRREPSRRAH